MFDSFAGATSVGAPSSCSMDLLRDFVSGHRDALINAAALLSGRRGERLVFDVLDELERGIDLTGRGRRKLSDLVDILMLENVDDFETEESARFAQIDPASPVVAEICLLADGLCAAIARAGLNGPQPMPPSVAA